MKRNLAEIEEIRELVKSIRKFEKKIGWRLDGVAGNLAEQMVAHELGLILSQEAQGPDAFKNNIRYEIKSRHIGSLSIRGNTTAMSVPTYPGWDIYVVAELDDDYSIISLWSAKSEDLKSIFSKIVVQEDGSNKRTPQKTVQRSRIFPYATIHEVQFFAHGWLGSST